MHTKLFLFAILFLGYTTIVSSQFKQSQNPTLMNGYPQSSTVSSLFNWIDPNRFSMNHSFSMNYVSGKTQSMSLGMYTNSMQYIFSDLLSARADVSMMYSPNSYSWRPGQTSFSGIFLNNAQINYRPWKNVLFQLQYRQLPFGYYNSYSPFINGYQSSFIPEE